MLGNQEAHSFSTGVCRGWGSGTEPRWPLSRVTSVVTLPGGSNFTEKEMGPSH